MCNFYAPERLGCGLVQSNWERPRQCYMRLAQLQPRGARGGRIGASPNLVMAGFRSTRVIAHQFCRQKAPMELEAGCASRYPISVIYFDRALGRDPFVKAEPTLPNKYSSQHKIVCRIVLLADLPNFK